MLRIVLRRAGCLLFVVIVAACVRSATIPAPVSAPVPVVHLAAAPDLFMTSDGLRLRYRDIGSGQPVILIHGATRNLADWEGIGDSLALTHRVIALDQRGHGQSTKFADTKSYGWAMVDDIPRLLDHLRIDRAHFVGHSLGALVISGVAARYPKRVATATLIAGPFFPDSASFAATLNPYVDEMERGDGFVNFLKWLFPGMPDSVARGFSAQAAAANDMPAITAVFRSSGAMIVTQARAAEIRIPALVAIGAGDPLLPQSRDIARWWPGARLLEVADTNHDNIRSHPTVLSAIRDHLRAGRR